MNSRIMNKPKIKLSTYTRIKNIKFLNNIVKILHLVVTSLTSEKREYNYDRNSFDSRCHAYNDVTDTTELRLIASRRTF